MATRFQMVTRRQFGFSNKARLNPALVAALHLEGSICQTCRDIEKEVDAVPEGGDYVEAASFPGRPSRSWTPTSSPTGRTSTSWSISPLGRARRNLFGSQAPVEFARLPSYPLSSSPLE